MTHPAASRTLLVVEPCAETLAMVMEQAKMRGLSTLTAPDPQVALAMMDMASPDVLLTDLFLPQPDGFRLIREALKRSARTAVIATTEAGNEQALLEAVRAGAGDCLYKPALAEDLGMALDRALQRIPRSIDDVPGIEQLEYRLVIGSDPGDVESCVTWLIESTAMGLAETQRLHLRTTLIELIVNAVEHGSLEIFYHEKHEALSTDRFEALIEERRRNPRFATRRVIVRALYDKLHRRMRYAITDEGNGFTWNRFLTRSDQPCDSR
ncbi:MAG: response regulator, partial [Nitrospira sp.]|nr:response regulator [Nitrospira sp.]